MQRALVLLSASLLAACAAPARAPAAPPSSSSTSAALGEWVTDGGGAAPSAPPRSVRLGLLAAGPVRITPPPAAPARPRRAGSVAVQFQRADLVNALQFLAEAGRFNLILESGLSGQVTASLTGVEPYDALVALAEANGAVVAYENRIVMVKKR